MNLQNHSQKKAKESKSTQDTGSSENVESTESRYISMLVFKAEEFSGLVSGYFRNVRVVVLLILALAIAGISSFLLMPRDLNPSVEIPIVFVSTALPGASPSDVESLVTIPIEKEIRALDGVDTVFSSSSEGMSGITVQFLSDVKRKDAESDVQTAVQSVGGLPEDATTPRVDSLDFENQPIWTFALTGNGTDQASLNRFAEDLSDRLDDLSKVDRAETRGIEKQEVQVLIEPETLRSWGLDTRTVYNAVRNALNAFPSGTIETDTSAYSLSFDIGVSDLASLREVRLRVDDRPLRLGDIATVVERSVPGQPGAYLSTGSDETLRSVTFDIYRVSGERFDKAYEEAGDLVETVLKEQDGRYQIHTIYSLAEEVDKQFSSLFRSFLVTCILVFCTLFIFLGIRQAAIAAVALILTFLFTFLAMQLTGISLNFLSMFSLLLSLGLLVDVTIVVLSAITQYYNSKKFSAYESALLVFRDYKMPLVVTTLTTVWAFSPLLLATGIIGEFIKPIPIVVSSALLGSFLIGLFVVLPLMVILLEPKIPRRVTVLGVIIGLIAVWQVSGRFIPESPVSSVTTVVVLFLAIVGWLAFKNIFAVKHPNHFNQSQQNVRKGWFARSAANGIVNLGRVERVYRRILESILVSQKARRKTVFAVVVFFVFSVFLVGGGFVVNEFFPKEDTDYLYIGVEYPVGTKRESTQAEAIKLSSDMWKIPHVENISIQIGVKVSPDGEIAGTPGYDAFLMTLLLEPAENRKLTSSQIAEQVRTTFSDYNTGKLSVIELSGGPPAGADVVVTLLGDDYPILQDLASNITQFLEGTEGVATVDVSIDASAPKLVFSPDEDLFAQNGWDVVASGSLLRTSTSGLELENDVSFDDLSEERDVVLRVSDSVREGDSLSTASISGQVDSNSLFSYGTLTLEPNTAVITREDGKRTLSVSAGVSEGYNPQRINSALETHIKTLTFPTGYQWKTGGANEENNKSVQSIVQAMGLAFTLILATLVIQLNSYRKSLIVLLVVPLALSGVFTVFALLGIPLSFPALIGVLALFGIVVNNSIIVVDKINLNLRSGIGFLDSIVDAAGSRLEPILLSSLTTIIGLIPITLSDPIWQGLGGAIIAGLLFSGTIMLFFIPVVYFMWFCKDNQ